MRGGGHQHHHAECRIPASADVGEAGSPPPAASGRTPRGRRRRAARCRARRGSCARSSDRSREGAPGQDGHQAERRPPPARAGTSGATRAQAHRHRRVLLRARPAALSGLPPAPVRRADGRSGAHADPGARARPAARRRAGPPLAAAAGARPGDLERARALAACDDPVPIGVPYRNDDVPCYEDFCPAGAERTPGTIAAVVERELDRFTTSDCGGSAGVGRPSSPGADEPGRRNARPGSRAAELVLQPPAEIGRDDPRRRRLGRLGGS